MVADISLDEEIFTPHLLFFNKDLQFYSACYFLSTSLDSIRQNVIYGLKNDFRAQRINWYRNELPSKYRIVYSSKQMGYPARSQRIIEKIIVGSSSDTLTFIAKTSANVVEGLGWDKHNPKSIDLSQFTKKDTVVVPLERLLFNPSTQIISHLQYNDTDIIENDMIILDPEIFKVFTRDLLLKLNLKYKR